jgi:hypothetical protein
MAVKYNKNYGDTQSFSDTCWQIELAANTKQTITIPGNNSNQYQVLFSYTSTSNVFVTKNASATVPGAGATTTQQYNEFRPEKRYVVGGETLSFITPDSGPIYVGVSLLQLP